jgi:uncharacterized membrane protein
MNLAHVHLLLNHFPTIGFAIGLGLFLVALASRNEELKRASLVVFFLMAVVTIATYTSGSAAQAAVAKRPEISQALVRAHEDAAFWSLVFMELTGFIAWLGLWQFRLIKRLAGWNAVAVLILSILTFSVTLRTSLLGSDIRHPEIFSEQQAASTGETAVPDVARSIGDFVNAHAYAWPTLETLHFVGLSLLFTVVLIVDLRLLGMAKKFSFAALYQLLPVGMLGFGLNLVTGMMFFITTPEQYVKNVAFHWKIALVMLAGINALYFMLVDEPWMVGPGDDAPATAKFAAASAIILWVGVLFFGHMLPFLGNSF